MNERISVEQFLENKELLELNYVPYEQRVEICRTIITQCMGLRDYRTIDSVLLDRVKTEIFITSMTNLDFSVKDENNLDGYDQLCFYEELESVIDYCGSFYEQFDNILELMLKDLYNDELSLKGYLSTLKTKAMNRLSVLRQDATDFIDGLDAQEIANNIVDFINANQINGMKL